MRLREVCKAEESQLLCIYLQKHDIIQLRYSTFFITLTSDGFK